MTHHEPVGWSLDAAQPVKAAGQHRDGSPRQARGTYYAGDGWRVRLTVAISADRAVRCTGLSLDQDQERLASVVQRWEAQMAVMTEDERVDLERRWENIRTTSRGYLAARGIKGYQPPDALPGKTPTSVTTAALRDLPVDDMATLLAAAVTLTPQHQWPEGMHHWRYDDLRKQWAALRRGKRSRKDVDRDLDRLVELHEQATARAERNITAYISSTTGWSRSTVQRRTREARAAGLLRKGDQPRDHDDKEVTSIPNECRETKT